MRFSAVIAASLAFAGFGAAQADNVSISPESRKALSLAVYNGGGLVRDTRTVSVSAGRSTLSFVDVSAEINAETALLKDAPFDILEQNFDFDLLTPAKLLEKSVGRSVRLHSIGANGQETVQDATILGVNDGVVLKAGDHIEAMSGISDASRRITFDSLPTNLRSRPTLSMVIDANAPVSRDLMLTYLTAGLDWKADYVATLAPDDKSLSLQGWITITNTSGSPYENAQVQVIAGEVSLDVRRSRGAGGRQLEAIVVSARKAETAEDDFFAYHLYTLPGPVTLAEGQTKQIALLEAPHIAVRPVLESRGEDYWYTSRVGELRARPVAVFIKFDNREQDGLGKPLPAGSIRVYKDDSRGQTQLVGQDDIRSTPRNEQVSLDIGGAFDVTVAHKQTDYKQSLKRDDEDTEATSSWEVTVKNAKKEPVDVRVVENMDGDWNITAESLPHRKESATEAVWTVHVPAGGQTTFSYTVRMRAAE